MLLDDVGPSLQPIACPGWRQVPALQWEYKGPNTSEYQKNCQAKRATVLLKQKILLHPSINATIVTKVHLVSHNLIHPVNSQASRLLSNRITSKISLKDQKFLSLPCAQTLPQGCWEHLSSWAWILTASAAPQSQRWAQRCLTGDLPSHWSLFSLQPLFLRERQFSAATPHGRLKELW